MRIREQQLLQQAVKQELIPVRELQLIQGQIHKHSLLQGPTLTLVLSLQPVQVLQQLHHSVQHLLIPGRIMIAALEIQLQAELTLLQKAIVHLQHQRSRTIHLRKKEVPVHPAGVTLNPVQLPGHIHLHQEVQAVQVHEALPVVQGVIRHQVAAGAQDLIHLQEVRPVVQVAEVHLLQQAAQGALPVQVVVPEVPQHQVEAVLLADVKRFKS